MGTVMGKREHADMGRPERAERGSRVGVKEADLGFAVRQDFLTLGLPRSVWAPAGGPAVREREGEILTLTRVSEAAFGAGIFQRQGSLGLS